MEWKEHLDLHAKAAGWGWSQGRKVTKEHCDQSTVNLWKRFNEDPEYKEQRLKQMSAQGSINMSENWKCQEFIDGMRDVSSKNMSEFWKWIKDNPDHQGSIEYMNMLSTNMTDRNNKNWENTEYREFMSEMRSRKSSEFWASDNSKEVRDYRSSTDGKRDYQRTRIYSLVREILSYDDTVNFDTWDDTVVRYLTENKLNNRKGRYKYTIAKYYEGGVNEVINLARNPTNHKVRSVELINLETSVPVYDFTVDTHHNFALESGVFVHNSLHTPGACKHLKSLTKKLIDLRILKR
jgi:DNA gyrase subunit B